MGRGRESGIESRFDGSRRSACPTRQTGSGSSWWRAGAGRARRPCRRPRRSRRSEPRARPGARSLLFTSGKGGVGTSNLVLNLAIALGELGQDVLVIDADIGLANLDLLCGLAPRYDLGDVLAGRCGLGEAVMTGPGGIRIVPGAHAIRTGAEMLEDGADRLVDELGELESESDFVLVDAGSGLGPGATKLAAAADSAVIVSTPEPTSLADAHAAIGRFRRLPAPLGSAWWSTRPGRPRRRPRCSTGSSPPAASSWARWSRRWGRGRCVPTPTSAWPSAPVGRL